jgi:hypothetical protein
MADGFQHGGIVQLPARWRQRPASSAAAAGSDGDMVMAAWQVEWSRGEKEENVFYFLENRLG